MLVVRSTTAALTCAFFLLVAAGCRAAPSGRKLPVREPFIALERDFQGFESWIKVDLSHRPAIGSTHIEGEAHEYVNQLPVPGAKVFPTGTIIVKTVKVPIARAGTAPGSAQERTDVFAMVKRGAGYNGAGTPGWEWFELRRREDESLGIVWRGINPPSGEGYGGDPLGGCNSCHQMAIKNDYVHASALTLSKL